MFCLRKSTGGIPVRSLAERGAGAVLEMCPAKISDKKLLAVSHGSYTCIDETHERTPAVEALVRRGRAARDCGGMGSVRPIKVLPTLRHELTVRYAAFE